MIHHVLAATPAQQDRDIYSFAFTFGCVWLLLLFLSEGFRNWHWWIPGGWVTTVILAFLVIGITAYLLH